MVEFMIFGAKSFEFVMFGAQITEFVNVVAKIIGFVTFGAKFVEFAQRCLQTKCGTLSYRTMPSRASGVPCGSSYGWFLCSIAESRSIARRCLAFTQSAAPFPIEPHPRVLLGHPVARAMAPFGFYRRVS